MEEGVMVSDATINSADDLRTKTVLFPGMIGLQTTLAELVDSSAVQTLKT